MPRPLWARLTVWAAKARWLESRPRHGRACLRPGRHCLVGHLGQPWNDASACAGFFVDGFVLAPGQLAGFALAFARCARMGFAAAQLGLGCFRVVWFSLFAVHGTAPRAASSGQFDQLLVAAVDGVAGSGLQPQRTPSRRPSLGGFDRVLGALSAWVWATYSLCTRLVPPFPSASIGLFAAVSGLLSLACHWALEPSAPLAGSDWVWIALMGFGPMGLAFYLWDTALKQLPAAKAGLLSFLTPLLSTALLLGLRNEPPTLALAGATVCVLGAAWVGARKS
jgi:hypothetical protein